MLDRNGLRPSRYYITHDDKCIMASEVGVLQVDGNVHFKGVCNPANVSDRLDRADYPDESQRPDQRQTRYGDWLAQSNHVGPLASTAPAPSLDNGQTLSACKHSVMQGHEVHADSPGHRGA